MNERSDTPRTDAIVRSHVQDGPYVTEHHDLLADFARTLERELKDAEEDSEVLHNYHNNPEWLKHRVKGRDYSFPEFVDNIIAERDQLRADLKMCAEALNQKFGTLSLHEYLFIQFPATRGHIPLRDFCINQDEALLNPRIQALLKGK